MKQYNNEINRRFLGGFTLIEMIVVVALFSMVIIASSELFITTYNVAKSTNSTRKINQDVRYALDTISRESRLAKSITINHKFDSPPDQIIITSKDGTQTTFNCLNCSPTTEGVIRMIKGTDTQNLTASTTLVRKFEISDSEFSKENNPSNIQPFFKLTIEAETKEADRTGTRKKITLESVISKRNYFETINRGIAVSGGASHSLVLKYDGTVWGTGRNSPGQLGLGGGGQRNLWDLTPLRDITDISSGSEHSLALKSDGKVWATGQNNRCQLGPGSTRDLWSEASLGDVTAISTGFQHSLALKSNGTVWGAGSDQYGQLGLGGGDKCSWTQIPTLSDIVAVSAGTYHSLALKSDGTLWVTGNDAKPGNICTIDGGGANCGPLGLGGGTLSISSWTQVPTPTLADVIAISAGWHHSLALKSDGTLWTTGRNNMGQLGLGNSNPISSWTKVSDATLKDVTAISASGWGHSLALKSNGTLWVTGRGNYGQLGLGPSIGSKDIWTQVPTSTLKDVTVISAGNGHSLALKSDGTLWVTGYNMWGQLGLGYSGSDINTWTQSW